MFITNVWGPPKTPRRVEKKGTIGKDLPKGFQTSEFLLEKGFLDFIVHRKDLKVKIKKLLAFFKN